MGEYQRTTRECTLTSMSPLLAAPIRAHIERYELGDVAADAVMCCETTSTRQKKGWLGGKSEVILTGVVLTPQWLIWASGREGEAPGVLSARLRDLQVHDYEQSEMNRLVPDTGLNLSGLRTDSVDLGSTFLGFGPEPAAQRFRALLKEAAARA